MKEFCFYHNADLDGVCSGAIIKHFKPECILYGINYGDMFPWGLIESEVKPTVYMVDFSLPYSDMERLNKISTLIWIDHHKSAIEEMAPLNLLGCNNLLCVGLAGCELSWNYMSGKIEVPTVVKLLGRYDVWDHSDESRWYNQILPFQYGLINIKDIYLPSNPIWQRLFNCKDDNEYKHRYIDLGNAILNFQRSQVNMISDNGSFESTLLDLNGNVLVDSCICINTPINNSMSFDSCYDESKHKIMIAFRYIKSGSWRVSLYTTRSDIDCSVIAKNFDGGGHKQAAGFLCDNIFELLGVK